MNPPPPPTPAPAGPPPGDGQAPAEAAAPEIKKKRLLLVEDDAPTRLALMRMLRQAGFDVDVAVNGALALEKVRKNCPDALFMDLLLPEVKGVDVIKEARRHPQFGGRPIFVCASAARMGAWSHRALKAGATKVFDRATMPIDAIVADIVAVMAGKPATNEVPPPTPQPSTEVSPPPPLVPPALAEPLPPPTVPSYHLMKRVLKSLGLGKSAESRPPSTPVPPAAVHPGVSEPTGPAQAHAPSAPAGDSASAPVYLPAIGQASGAAVVTLDESNQILSTDEACCQLFGWEQGELVGQNLKVLLQEGVDHLVASFLQKKSPEAAKQGGGAVHLNARRKDGTQFPASVTTLTWNSDTALLHKGSAARFTWTAVFRPLVPLGGAPAASDAAPMATPPMQPHIHPPPVPAKAQPGPAEPAAEGQAVPYAEAAVEAARHEVHLVREALQRERAQRQALEQQINELASARATLEQQLNEQGAGQANLQETAVQLDHQLAEANASAGMAAAALQEQIARSRFTEEEAASVRRDREELHRRLAAEQEAAVALRQRSAELEQQLEETSRNLESARAEATRRTQESGQLTSAQQAQDSDLARQLGEAKAAVERAEASLKEESNRNRGFEERLRLFGNTLRTEQLERAKRFEEETVQLRRQRDELQTNLEAEQRAAAEAKRRADELESRLAENADTLANAQAERDRRDSEREQSEAELRVQLATAESLTKQLAQACAEAEARTRQLEGELGELRRQQDTLNGKFAAEQEAAAGSRQRVVLLEGRLRDNDAELERVKGELQKGGRTEGFEVELGSLRQVRDALCSKLTAEQWAGTEASRRSAELEKQLSSNAAELERVKAALDKMSGEQAEATAALQEQLQAATAATARLQGDLQEQNRHCQHLETELTQLQQERRELSVKLASDREAAAEFKQRSGQLEGRLAESTAELQRLKAERDQQTAQQAALDAQLQEQLLAARNAAEQAEAARREEAVRHREFEERLRQVAENLQAEETKRHDRSQKEMGTLQKQQDDLQKQLAQAKQAAATAEQARRDSQAELEKARESIQQHTKERSGAEAELRSQLNAAKTAAKKLETAIKQANAQSSRYEQELTNYRQERHEIYEKFGAEQTAGAKAKRRIRQLEKELEDATHSLTTAKEQAEKGTGDRGRVESTLRAELAAAQGAAQKAEAARQAQAAQTQRLKADFDKLQAKHDEVSARQSAGQDSAAETNRRIEELERRLRESAAELGRAQAALANQSTAKTTSDSATPADQSPEVQQELSRLRETEAAQTAELAEMERRVRDTVTSLARVTADLEKERGERRRVEARSTSLTAQLQELHESLKQHLESERSTQERIHQLEQHVLERDDVNSRVQADLQKEAAARQLAEDQLRATEDLKAHLRNCLASFEQAKTGFRRMQEELNTRLKATQAALSESEARAQKEAGERQRAEEGLAAARRSLQEAQSADLELTQLKSELQLQEFEKQRMQAESVQSRVATVDSARVGNAMVNSLRRQIRQPVEDLLQSTRRLLEGGLEAEQKKLAESVLENALLLQSGLQEAGNAAAPARATGDKSNATLQA
jgi:PAS domain S-box-containing protein